MIIHPMENIDASMYNAPNTLCTDFRFGGTRLLKHAISLLEPGPICSSSEITCLSSVVPQNLKLVHRVSGAFYIEASMFSIGWMTM